MWGRNILHPAACHILLLVFSFWVRQFYCSQVVLYAPYLVHKIHTEKMTMQKMSKMCWTSLVRVYIFYCWVTYSVNYCIKNYIKTWSYADVNLNINDVTWGPWMFPPPWFIRRWIRWLCQKSHFNDRTSSSSPVPDRCPPVIHVWSSCFHGWSSQGTGSYVTMTSSLYLKPNGATIIVVMIMPCRKLSCLARSAESCQCWAIARTLLPPSCVLYLAALLLWVKQ